MLSFTDIHAKIQAVCPIDGMSFGLLTDKATWHVDFSSSATVPQKTAATTTIAAIDINDTVTPDPIPSWDVVSLKVAFNHENRIRALEARPTITAAQFLTVVRAIVAST